MTVEVKMLSVGDCKDCKAALKVLKSAGKKSGVDYKLTVYGFLTDAAVDLSIEHGFEVIPSFVIGNIPMQGPTFKEDKIVDALKKQQG